MKLSVVVIAHNEARYIAKCLDSIFRQTLQPDEVILVAHNCTDETVEIAKQYNKVQIIQLDGPEGIAFARARGFEEAKGEIIACIDGDSWAIGKNWLRDLISRLYRREILAVGGGVLLVGGLVPFLMSLDFFWLKPIYNFFILGPRVKPEDKKYWNGNYFWGANFAIKKSAYEKIGGLIPSIQLFQKLGLSLAPEDLYLTKKVSEVGEVAIWPWAMVVSVATKTNWRERTKLQGQDKWKLINYLNKILDKPE